MSERRKIWNLSHKSRWPNNGEIVSHTGSVFFKTSKTQDEARALLRNNGAFNIRFHEQQPEGELI